jgi:hypothetical protein
MVIRFMYFGIFSILIIPVKAMYTQIINLTLRGPCIVMYFYNESQRDELFLKFI